MIFIFKAWHSRGQRFDPAYLHKKQQTARPKALRFCYTYRFGYTLYHISTQLLTMTVNWNSHILCQCLLEDVSYMAADKANMMFISIFANIAQQILQVLNITVCYTAFGRNHLIPEHPFAKISLDRSPLVIRG